ncbi:MAG: hypothetical protein WBV69_13450 [Candidatus Sulfotelmatobacter sp.]
MNAIRFKPERQAQLEEYAQGTVGTLPPPSTMLWRPISNGSVRNFEQATQAIRRGHEDVKAGHTRSAAEFLSEVRRKHDLSR